MLSYSLWPSAKVFYDLYDYYFGANFVDNVSKQYFIAYWVGAKLF